MAWAVAQGLKYVFVLTRRQSIGSWRQLYLSGRMPSAHSAAVTAVATLIGVKDGWSTPEFGVAALFAAIVIYDSVMVRRSVGEQGEAIQALIKDQKSKIRLPRAAKGHTPMEALVGGVIGAVIGYIVFLTTN